MLRCETVQFNNQVIPGGVTVSITVQVAAQTVPQVFLSFLFLELAHHDGGLVINDVAVEQTSLIQVIKGLLNRVCALCAVDAHRCRVMHFDEGQVVVQVRELFPCNFVGHKVGKHFFGPHVVEPTHRHQVAEPHV